jgi:hypothetical protein
MIRSSNPSKGKRFFSSPKHATVEPTTPLIQWLQGLSRRVNGLKRGFDLWPSTNAEVQNVRSYDTTRLTCLHNVDKHKFIFALATVKFLHSSTAVDKVHKSPWDLRSYEVLRSVQW